MVFSDILVVHSLSNRLKYIVSGITGNSHFKLINVSIKKVTIKLQSYGVKLISTNRVLIDDAN